MMCASYTATLIIRIPSLITTIEVVLMFSTTFSWTTAYLIILSEDFDNCGRVQWKPALLEKLQSPLAMFWWKEACSFQLLSFHYSQRQLSLRM